MAQLAKWDMEMNSYTFNTTASIHQELGGSSKIGELINIVPSVKKNAVVMLVTDPGIMKLGLADSALKSLSKSGFKAILFDQVEADPQEHTVLSAVETAKQENVSTVIGFGGGSSMDVAKLISFLVCSKQEISSIYGVNQAVGSRLPLMLVPTTAGTGSEVTAVSIVTTGVDEKKELFHPYYYQT